MDSNMVKPEDARLKSSYLAHGALMFLAFGVFFPLGVFVVRYAKPFTRHYVWHHIGVQILGWILATIAVIIAYAQFPKGAIHTMHGKLGSAIVALVWLQPLLAVFRPKRGATIRPAWFVVHWLIGTGIIILGWINIFFGIDLYKGSFYTNCNNIYILYAVWISVVGITYLFLDRYPYIRDQAHDSQAEEKRAYASDDKSVNVIASKQPPAGSVV